MAVAVPNYQRLWRQIRNVKRNFHRELKTQSQLEFWPNRRVIGRIFTFAHLAIDSRSRTSFGESFARQDSIDPQPAIFRKRKHPIIPPGKNAGFLRVQSQRVPQTDLTDFLKPHPPATPPHHSPPPNPFTLTSN